jgi:hypothetical protein
VSWAKLQDLLLHFGSRKAKGFSAIRSRTSEATRLMVGHINFEAFYPQILDEGAGRVERCKEAHCAS